jgi:hypothetical protein
MKRRGFLQLLAAAPIAALVPWRPPSPEWAVLPIDPWQQELLERILKQRRLVIGQMLNPWIVLDPKTGIVRREPEGVLYRHLAMLEQLKADAQLAIERQKVTR